MTYLMPLLGRTCFYRNAYNSRFLFKRTSSDFLFRNMSYRCFANSSKRLVLNSNVISTSFCSSKFYKSSNRILVTVCIRTHKNLRYFHTSERRYFHPVVWAILRPGLKFLAIITGRAFRKWWRDLPPNKKKYFLQVAKENKHKIAIFAILCGILSGAYYVSHLEETPITKRMRFMAFSSDQWEMLNKLELQRLMKQLHGQILPAHHPYTYRVQAVVSRILEANKDIEEVKGKKWGVSIINSSVENAFVTPIGHVFVYTGMLSLFSNDDELAIVLSHEIAHCLQSHGAENASLGHLLDLISVVIIAAIWAMVPNDILSVFSHMLYNKCKTLFLTLPYSRHIEKEADAVGLDLAAKACFDVRESSAFWAKMAYLHNIAGAVPDIEFLSTHPSHANRSEHLDSLMDQAINLRSECGCPKLRARDPRSNVEIMAKALDAARKKYLQQFPKPILRFDI